MDSRWCRRRLLDSPRVGETVTGSSPGEGVAIAMLTIKVEDIVVLRRSVLQETKIGTER